MKNAIVLLAANDSYSMPLAVTGHSVASHASKDYNLHIHVVDVDISDENKKKIEELWHSAHPKLSIFWRKVDLEIFASVNVRRYSIASMGRILIPQLFEPLDERVLYLDSDIVVETDITKLWDIDLGKRPVWAVQNAADENFQDYILKKFPFIKADADARYFNSGVLLINIPKWIEQDVTGRVVDFLKTYGDQLSYPDQDALNAILPGNWGALPGHWNKQVMRIGRPEAAPFSKPGIVHYTTRKPWDADYTQAARMIFHRAYLKSGWQKAPAAHLHVAKLVTSQIWHKKYAGLMRRINRFRPKGQ